MPELGKDNITGERYTLDLGVEPDMGNLIQNLTVVNELLEGAQSHMQAMGDAVGDTMGRMRGLTAETQRYVQQISRVRAELSSIANVGQTLISQGPPNIGGGGGGSGVSDVALQQLANSVNGITATLAGLGAGAALSAGRSSGVQDARVSRGGGLNRLANNFFSLRGYLDTFSAQGGGRTSAAIADGGGYTMSGPIQGGIPPMPGMPADPNMPPMPGEAPAAAEGGMAGTLSKFLGPTLGKLAAGAIPGIGQGLLIYEGVKKVFDLATDRFRSAQHYTGLTGGTSVVQAGQYDFERWMRGLNPLVNNEQAAAIMELPLAAGFEGNTRHGISDYLEAMVKNGFEDVGASFDTFMTVVQKAKGSTQVLTDSIEQLRSTARDTASGVVQLMQTFRGQASSLTSLGVGGNVAAPAASLIAGMYGRSNFQTVRELPGADVSSPQMQAYLTQFYGSDYLHLPFAMAQGGSTKLAEATYVASRQAVESLLTPQDFANMDQYGWQGVLASGKQELLRQRLIALNILPPDVDINTVAQFVYEMVHNKQMDPRIGAANQLKGLQHSWSGTGMISGLAVGRGTTGNHLASGLETTVGMLQHHVKGISGIDPWSSLTNADWVSGHPIAAGALTYMQAKHHDLPLLNQLISSGDADRTYVKIAGKTMTLSEAMSRWGSDPNSPLMKAIANGSIQVATVGSNAPRISTKNGIVQNQNAIRGDLWQSGSAALGLGGIGLDDARSKVIVEMRGPWAQYFRAWAENQPSDGRRRG